METSLDAPGWCVRPSLGRRGARAVSAPRPRTCAWERPGTGRAGSVTDVANVIHAPERSRFESGSASLSYARHDNTIDLQHTIVPPEMEGHGVGGGPGRAPIGLPPGGGPELGVARPFAGEGAGEDP